MEQENSSVDLRAIALRAAALGDEYSRLLNQKLLKEPSFSSSIREYFASEPPSFPHSAPVGSPLWEKSIWVNEEMHPKLARLQRETLVEIGRIVGRLYGDWAPRELYTLLHSLALHIRRHTYILFDPLPVLIHEAFRSRSSAVRAADS